jgi:putative FmdB family regulatory protein
MPIYEYQCQSCQHAFESLQKLSDAVLTECPECHKPALRKKISAAGFRLTGSGWYETDFKKSGSKKNLAGEGGGDTKTESKDKSDSKGESGSKTDSVSSKSDNTKSASKPAAASE